MNIKTAGLDDKIELFKASVKGMRVSFQSEAFEVQSLLWFSGCIGAQSRASPKATFGLLTSSSQVLSILKTGRTVQTLLPFTSNGNILLTGMQFLL